MKTAVKKLNEIQVKVDVEIPAADVDREIERQLAMWRKQANIKGFRAGKAPKELVRRQYGMQAAAGATRALIDSTLREALVAAEVAPIGQPNVEPGVAAAGQTFQYSIILEVKPEVTVSNWEGLELSAPPADVQAEAIDAEIGRLQHSQRERVPVEDRAIDQNDMAVITFTGDIDGENDPRLSATEMDVRVGEGMLIPGFEDQLVGANTGDKRDVTVTFPEDYHAEDLAGKEAVFHVEIVRHMTEELPDLDDDFAQDLGHDDFNALRESVVEKLQKGLDSQRRAELERRAIAVLCERNTIPVPPSMTQMQLDATARRTLDMFRMQGMPEEQAMNYVRGNIESMGQNAEQAVRRYLLVEGFAEQEKITVTDEELNEEILRRVEANEAREGQFDKDDEREILRMELREQRALDLIISKAIVSDLDPEEKTAEEGTEEASEEAPSEPETEDTDAADTDASDKEE